ncbi:MAG TPA: Gfo/Idh/MocA family oxidoreductase [Dongiaceae bacterium]
MTRIRVGIIGAGLITQVEHLPNLLALPQLFEVVAVADPSAKVRSHLTRRWGVETAATPEALFDKRLDAAVVATPDALHARLIIAALERGLHVFTEKPLCYAVDDADAVIRARDKAKRVVQVGYMKRFDPAYEALAAMVRGQGAKLRYVSVEVNDPDSWPFTAHRDLLAGDDVPAALIEETRQARAEQVARALGAAPDEAQLRGFAGPYCSSVIHDVNLVHGLLDEMQVATGDVAGAAWFAKSAGGHGSVRLTPGNALWSMAHIAVPGVADYLERVSLWFDDRIIELQFPSPYLNHQPTLLIEKRSEGHHARTIHHRPSYAEAFVEELKGWWRSIAEGAPVRNTLEAARRDLALLAALGRRALKP